MADILILDRDNRFAGELAGILRTCGNYALTETTVMREACLILAGKPHDLAFVSEEESASAIGSLRRLQPGLPVILTVTANGPAIQPELKEQVQKILLKEQAREQACILVRSILEDNSVTALVAEGGRFDLPRLQPAITARLNMALGDGAIVAILLTSAGEILAYAGELSAQQAQRLRESALREWAGAGERSVQVQFSKVPGYEEALLLYTRAIGERDQLTLVVRPDNPLRFVREEADKLAGHLAAAYDPALARELHVSEALLDEGGSDAVISAGNCYALLWRPIAEIPVVLRLPLRRSLARVAMANGCVLTYAEVAAEFVHIVVECPLERNSAWAALLFKQVTEQEIQQRFGIRIALWEGGYLATVSSEPFSDEVLSQYLDGTPIEDQ